jgi:hypothetical protein
MAGLVPAIHVFGRRRRKTWMPATSAGMTSFGHWASVHHATDVTRVWGKPTCSRRLTPELCIILAPSKSKRGRREGRVQAAPMARQQIKKLAAVTTG